MMLSRTEVHMVSHFVCVCERVFCVPALKPTVSQFYEVNKLKLQVNCHNKGDDLHLSDNLQPNFSDVVSCVRRVFTESRLQINTYIMRFINIR